MKISNRDSTVFTQRDVLIIDFPFDQKIKIARPEQVMFRFDRMVVDSGAFCYLKRSNARRMPQQPVSVDESSYCSVRAQQVGNIIEIISTMLEDGGVRPVTVFAWIKRFKVFIDWADDNSNHDCLDGGEATKIAFRSWMEHISEKFKHGKIKANSASYLQNDVCKFLEQITDHNDLRRGIQFISVRGGREGAEPASEYDFAQTLALNQSLFDGLCNLVLENQPFPFKLKMPKFPDWKENHLWLFPVNRWSLPPHLREKREQGKSHNYWAYDYENGRLANVEEIAHHYNKKNPRRAREAAKKAISEASANLDRANNDVRDRMRIELAMFAQSTFLFLFQANTGCNLAVSREIETAGSIDVSTLNQSYRVIKMRAQGREISVVSPASFMPSLRRFMELRKYILNGKNYLHLFFELKNRSENSPPEKVPSIVLYSHYENLRRIYPTIPRLSTRIVRATVSDYYRRTHDGYIESRVMGHSEAVADRDYLAGSPVDHHTDFTLFLNAVSNSARKQKIVSPKAVPPDAKSLEEGGRCTSLGRPEPITITLPIPDCKQGCIFCANRILVAGEEDARKVASAAFLMEQLISGPLSEAEFRPRILKCDQDLEQIAGFEGCENMVSQIKRDVYERGNLTPYFADKFQLFLELGVL